jgi:hypothetical protein
MHISAIRDEGKEIEQERNKNKQRETNTQTAAQEQNSRMSEPSLESDMFGLIWLVAFCFGVHLGQNGRNTRKNPRLAVLPL